MDVSNVGSSLVEKSLAEYRKRLGMPSVSEKIDYYQLFKKHLKMEELRKSLDFPPVYDQAEAKKLQGRGYGTFEFQRPVVKMLESDSAKEVLHIHDELIIRSFSCPNLMVTMPESCNHIWETKFLFTSNYTKCSLCGVEE